MFSFFFVFVRINGNKRYMFREEVCKKNKIKDNLSRGMMNLCLNMIIAIK